MLSRPEASADLAVHRARVTGWRGTRAEVARWLDAVPVASLGLGPEELLYLPRLRVQVPVHQGSTPGRMPDRIVAELRALLAGAESGWGNGFSPGRAYRFTSRGRYFAWLVALWVKDGSAPARAAFHTATGEVSLQQWQRTTVLQDGAAFIATVARLAEIGCAARWIARFEPAEIVLVRHALEQRFALRLEPLAGPSVRLVSEARAAPGMAALLPPILSEAIARLDASGDAWRALPASRKALLLAAVTLARSPARAMAQPAALAAAILRFSDPVEARSDGPVAAIPQSLPALRRAPEPAHPLVPAKVALPENAHQLTEARARRPTPSQPFVLPATQARNPAADGEPVTEAGHIPAAPPADAEDRAESVVPMAPPLSPGPVPAAPSVRVPFLAPDARFETGFGGLFFLLNAFVALGLYPDFTQPKGARLDPSPLWLADRIGRYWFGARYRGDPLALWIAAHAAPGRLPGTWRAEPDWLTGFETRAPRRVLRRDRVTLWHPAGFPLVDEAQGRSPRRPGRVVSSHRPPARLPSTPSDRWAACLALYLDARLRLSCGAGLSLLALPACVQIRDLDLSARFALDCYPIQLRIAGLDRDPGWQPAEGRTIAFVFE